MKTLHFVSSLLTLLFLAEVAKAGDQDGVDLSRIDRTIAKEPAYQTKVPRYCLLVFGPEAKFRVWLVQDGDVLYVDRNGNGNLTEAGKCVTKQKGDAGSRVFEVGELTDGALKHAIPRITEVLASEAWIGDAKEFARLRGKHDLAINPWIHVRAERPADDHRTLPKHIEYIVNGDGAGYLAFADRPQDAPIVHLNGPWTFGLQDIKQHLVVGEKKKLQLGVGTPGLGPGTFSFVLYPNTIPKDAYPVGDFSFPAGEPGGKELTRTVIFKERC